MANKFEEVKVKALPIKIDYGSFQNASGETIRTANFYVDVDVDGEAERVALRIQSGMKKRQLVKHIESGEIFNLRLKAGQFKAKDGKMKYGCLFYVPLVVGGYDCEVRAGISGEYLGADGKVDNRLERFLVLRELGVKFDSDEGIEEVDLPFAN